MIYKQPLKVGDLVEFYTVGPMSSAMERYPSNGIIIGVRPGSHEGAPDAYTVVWAGGIKKTTEWRYYLRKLS